MKPSQSQLELAVSRAVHRYGLNVRTVPLAEMPRPAESDIEVRGAFSSSALFIPTGNVEEAFFILVHSVGHLAQWIIHPKEQSYSFAFRQKTESWKRSDLMRHFQHELQSVPYSLGFLKELGVDSLNGWFLQYFKADQEYMADFLERNNYMGMKLFDTILNQVRSKDDVNSLQVVPLPFPESLDIKANDDLIYVI